MEVHVEEFPARWQRLLQLASFDIHDRDSTVEMRSLRVRSQLGRHVEQLSNRCVLIITHSQVASALAILELDGLAHRIVIAPPDVRPEHIAEVIVDASVDYVVSDVPELSKQAGQTPVVRLELPRPRSKWAPSMCCDTEWVMFTSGTNGRPKMVRHTVRALLDAVKTGSPKLSHRNWATFYDIRRFGGLQIFLRAVLGNVDLFLTDRNEPLTAFLRRLATAEIAAISGTPSHWRRVLMSGAQRLVSPQYIRLSGEIADQTILDGLRAAYPKASIEHAFASTEAGVAFAVSDGLAGFPVELLASRQGIDIRVVDGTLRIKSQRAARGYVGCTEPRLSDVDGFVDTGDLVERRGNRLHFVGRRGGIINVGGNKVNPEEVEAVLNIHPAVQESCVRSRQNPLTGGLVIADIVLGRGREACDKTKTDIIDFCRDRLDYYKVPASVRFVQSLGLSAGGKLSRQNG